MHDFAVADQAQFFLVQRRALGRLEIVAPRLEHGLAMEFVASDAVGVLEGTVDRQVAALHVLDEDRVGNGVDQQLLEVQLLTHGLHRQLLFLAQAAQLFFVQAAQTHVAHENKMAGALDAVQGRHRHVDRQRVPIGMAQDGLDGAIDSPIASGDQVGRGATIHQQPSQRLARHCSRRCGR